MMHAAIPESAITERFVQASGPGGQNVNRVATAVELRLSVAELGLGEAAQRRLEAKARRAALKAGRASRPRPE